MQTSQKGATICLKVQMESTRKTTDKNEEKKVEYV
jgi:hypothetical protein